MIEPNQIYVAADGSGICELLIRGTDVLSICQSGDNGPAVDAVYEHEYIKYQLKRFDPARVEEIIQSYGHDFFDKPRTAEETQKELLWLLSWDLYEEGDEYHQALTEDWLRHVLDEHMISLLQLNQ